MSDAKKNTKKNAKNGAEIKSKPDVNCKTKFKVEFYCPAAKKDYDSLDGSVRAMVDKGIVRLALRANEIGKPLSGLLAGCRELKFRANGIRIIYRIHNGQVEIVQIIAIGERDKGKVFDAASNRLEQGEGD